jgi:hypothetical protein
LIKYADFFISQLLYFLNDQCTSNKNVLFSIRNQLIGARSQCMRVKNELTSGKNQLSFAKNQHTSSNRQFTLVSDQSVSGSDQQLSGTNTTIFSRTTIADALVDQSSRTKKHRRSAIKPNSVENRQGRWSLLCVHQMGV